MMSGSLADLVLPEGASFVRSTPEFASDTVPAGLLRAHQVAEGVWGLLRVSAGEVTFVAEGSGESRRLGAGDTQVIEPNVFHHVEPGDDARFAVEFYR